MTERVYPGYRWFCPFSYCSLPPWPRVSSSSGPPPLLEQIAKHYSVDLGAATGALMVAFTIFVTVGAIVGGICCDKVRLGPPP